MCIVGLTGGIATGKSTVAAVLRELGVTVIDADVVAREVVEPDRPAWQDIVAYFGPAILRPDRTIDRRQLGRLIFDDPEKRAALNRITHPRVIERMRELQADAVRQQGATGLVVLDVPLLFEAGMTGMVDEVWVVTARPETQLQRLMERDGLSVAEARQRIAAQMPLAQKAAQADRVIENDGPVEATRAAVGRLVAETLELVKSQKSKVKS